MFPNHFLEHMRVMCRARSGSGSSSSLRGDLRRRREVAAAFDHVVRDWLKGVRLHPMLVTSSIDHERSRQRWQRKESHDILVDCSRYALDMIESTAADCGFVLGLADVPPQLSHSSCQEVAMLTSSASPRAAAASPSNQEHATAHLSYAQYLSHIQANWCGSGTTMSGLMPSSLSLDGASFKSAPSGGEAPFEAVHRDSCSYNSDAVQLASTGEFIATAARSRTVEPSSETHESSTDELKDSLRLGDDPSDDEGIAVSRPPLVHGLVKRIRLNTVGPLAAASVSAEPIYRHSRSISCPETHSIVAAPLAEPGERRGTDGCDLLKQNIGFVRYPCPQKGAARSDAPDGSQKEQRDAADEGAVGSRCRAVVLSK